MYQDDNIRHIEWQTYGETVINPIALILTLIMGVVILYIPRKYASITLIIIALLITNMQRIVIAGLDFDMLRILILFGIIRVIIKSEYLYIRFNIIDTLILAFTIISFIAYSILWKEFSSIIYKLGESFDIIGMYFLFRIFVTDLKSLEKVFIMLSIIMIPVTISMIIEQIFRYNVFSIFGGVPAEVVMRDGKLRAQGAFSHPILAGSFGASVFPIMWVIWIKNVSNIRYRVFALIGMITSIIITFTVNSSGAILSFLAGIFGLFIWKFRFLIRYMLIGIVVCLVILHIIMNDPVWAIIPRLRIISASDGWFRFMLIDQTIRRFSEWALFGVKTTAHWGWGLQDVTSMYIRVGVDGGIFSLLLFLAIIVFCFRIIGKALNASFFGYDTTIFIWGIGVSFFTHIISFVAVAYFGQMILFMYLSFAIIAYIDDLYKSTSSNYIKLINEIKKT